MKMKIVLWSVVSILIIGLAGGAYLRLRRPQVITFDSGDKLTLLGVDYGKRHVPPGVKAPATTASSTNVRPRIGRGGTFTTTTDMLVVWVRQEHDAKQYMNCQYYLYDAAGTACVGESGMNYGNGNRQQGNEVVAVQFNAFPRRQGKFVLRVQKYGPQGQEVPAGKFIIRNPARGSFSSWTAAALPATQEDDDLAVTLKKLTTGADMSYKRNQDDDSDAANKGVEATFQVQRNGKPVANWEPVSVTTSDATGNSVSGWIGQNNWQDNSDVVTYQYGLWADEPAWKVRFEFSQQTDFANNELWSVANIPLLPGLQQEMWNYNNNRRNSNTNTPVAETDLNGFHLKILPAKQFTDVPPNSQPAGVFQIQTTPSLPDGWRLTLVKLTDDQTNDVGNWNYGTTGNGTTTTLRFGLREISGVTNLNATIALHKSRFVEFTTKPAKAVAAQ
jgi:hypothetical protein